MLLRLEENKESITQDYHPKTKEMRTEEISVTCSNRSCQANRCLKIRIPSVSTQEAQ